jgi:hypothetical protein
VLKPFAAHLDEIMPMQLSLHHAGTKNLSGQEIGDIMEILEAWEARDR